MTDHICDIIQDLLPLYVDECCSKASRQMVKEHLDSCAECKQAWEKMTGLLPIQPQEIPQEDPASSESSDVQAARTMKKGLKKIRYRWLASLCILVLLLPMVFIYRYQFYGINLDNIQERFLADSFMRDLKHGNYDEAFEHFDLDSYRQEWLQLWFNETEMIHFEEDAKKYFREASQGLIDSGGITRIVFQNIGVVSPGTYSIWYVVTINNKNEPIQIIVSEDGVKIIKAYCPQLTALVEWPEHLWNLYADRYLNEESETYHYYDSFDSSLNP